MSEITHHRRGELLRGVFQIFSQAPDGLKANELLEKLAVLVPPTAFEQSTYPKRPDERRYEKIVRFSTIGPVKAGWMTKGKGIWTPTEEGLQAYRRITDPEKFSKEAGRLYRQWSKTQAGKGEEDTENDSPQASTILEEAIESSWTEIEEYLSNMNPFDFQNLVAGLVRGMGYHVAWISPPGPDKGIDILGHTDPLGVTGPRIKIQVKRRVEKANVDAIRSFLAVLADSDVGIFVSTGGFTREAEIETRGQERRRLTLIDLERLFDLWVEHYAAIPEEFRNLFRLQPVYFLTPDK